MEHFYSYSVNYFLRLSDVVKGVLVNKEHDVSRPRELDNDG